MIRSDGFFRAKELEAYEAMGSLDEHAETVRLILAVRAPASRPAPASPGTEDRGGACRLPGEPVWKERAMQHPGLRDKIEVRARRLR